MSTTPAHNQQPIRSKIAARQLINGGNEKCIERYSSEVRKKSLQMKMIAIIAREKDRE